jgi:hypothetical protein
LGLIMKSVAQDAKTQDFQGKCGRQSSAFKTRDENMGLAGLSPGFAKTRMCQHAPGSDVGRVGDTGKPMAA